jgi:hypothetical protein
VTWCTHVRRALDQAHEPREGGCVAIGVRFELGAATLMMRERAATCFA